MRKKFSIMLYVADYPSQPAIGLSTIQAHLFEPDPPPLLANLLCEEADGMPRN